MSGNTTLQQRLFSLKGIIDSTNKDGETAKDLLDNIQNAKQKKIDCIEQAKKHKQDIIR